MLQISADLSALTTEQREAISAFILHFPNSRNNHNGVSDNSECVIIPAFNAHSEEDEEDEQTPESVFSAGPVLVPESADPTPRNNVSPFPPSVTANLDKNGLPWDERIHAGSRVKVADGSWRIKRGVDAALVAQVESELKALMAVPGPVAVLAAPPTPPAPFAVTVAGVSPELPTAIAVVPPPPPPTADSKTAFIAMLKKATNAIQSGKLTQEQLVSAVISQGVPSIALLGNRLDLVPAVSATIDAMIGA